jgi:hypothetical protein
MERLADPSNAPVGSPVSLRFAAAARCLAEVAREAGCAVPSFRSPPTLVGRRRTLRRTSDGGVVVSLLVRGRPWSAVLADMIDGLVAANSLDPAAAEDLREACWAAFEHIDLSARSAA